MLKFFEHFLFHPVEVGAGTVIVDDDEAVAELAVAQDEPQAVDLTDEVEDAPAADETPADDAAAAAGAADDGEVVITLGDEPAPEEAEQERHAPTWLRDLRKSNREKDRRIRELEQQLNTAKPVQAVEVGARPSLEACGYDEDKFAAELEAWAGRKAAVERQQREREEAAAKDRRQWETRLTAVQQAAAALKVRDAEDAALVFDEAFSEVQKGIIFGGPEDPKVSAQLRYALGKNPAKAKELAAISDPVRFAFAVAKLETQMKVQPRKVAPAPERPVRSSVPGAAALDNTLEKLRAEADRTGDRTKVAAYLRSRQTA